MLSVDDGDMDNAIKLARKLKDDKFYEECSTMCIENYNESLYREEKCTEYLKNIFEDLYNE